MKSFLLSFLFIIMGQAFASASSADVLSGDSQINDAASKVEAIHASFLKLNPVSCISCHLQDAQKSRLVVHQPVHNFQNCNECHINYRKW